MSWQLERGKDVLIRLLAEPFGGPINIAKKIQKQTSTSSLGSDPFIKNSYNIKTMSSFAIDIRL